MTWFTATGDQFAHNHNNTITVQGYNAAWFAQIHDSVDDVVNLVSRHQRVTHAVMVREMRLRKKRGDAAGTQFHVKTSITDTHYSTLHDLQRAAKNRDIYQQNYKRCQMFSQTPLSDNNHHCWNNSCIVKQTCTSFITCIINTKNY